MPQSFVPIVAPKRGRGQGARAVALTRESGPVRMLSAGLVLLLAALLVTWAPARAADRDRIAAFAEVTGYDVVIESLQLAAAAAPAMAGEDGAQFGAQYSKLAREVFDPEALRNRAFDLLERTLDDGLLHAGAEFYASELGQRLVAVENASHLVSAEIRLGEGAALVEAMRHGNPSRLRALSALVKAVGNDDLTVAGIVEMQTRFILAAQAAQAAGAEDTTLSEEELRQRLRQAARQLLPQIRRDGLTASAYTYRDISDKDLADYARALNSDEIGALYLVLNKVQYQVMIEFYEKLGARLAEIVPEHDL